MPASVVTWTENAYPGGRTEDQRRVRKFGKISVAAGNYETGGLVLSFVPQDESIPQPVSVKMNSLKGSGYTYVWVTADLWPQNTVVVAGQAITDPNGNLQVVTVGGTTNNVAEPTWAKPSTGNPNPTTADGSTVVWTCQGPSSGTVKILQSAGSAAPQAEITGNSSTPAGVTGDVIGCEVEFLKG
jgi:hypothetical protein